MDPFSQFAFGALSASIPSKKNIQNSLDQKKIKWTLIIGGLSGMMPDLDIVIRSPSDDLLALEFHRHFTHSLFFVPFGALLAAFIFWFLFKRIRIYGKGWLYLTCFLGFLSHGPLDALTSYGTHLFWPLNNLRVSTSTIAVVDIFWLFPIALGLIFWWRKRASKVFWLTLGYCFFYFSLGFVQQKRAESFLLSQLNPNEERLRVELKTSMTNLILWRGLIETRDSFEVYAVHAPFFGKLSYKTGSKVEKMNSFFPGFDHSTIEKDFYRFKFFSQGWTYPVSETEVGDLRYSLLPDSIKPLWVAKFDPDQPERHMEYLVKREMTPEVRQKFFNYLFKGF